MRVNNVSHKRLLELLAYDPGTGAFTWRKLNGRSNKAILGRRAGSFYRSIGYRVIRIDKRAYTTGRLAWFYVHGKWPPHQIDHINRIRTDDRICNLRPATSAQNKFNRRPPPNRTGLTGVSYLPGGKYSARIKDGGIYRHLGVFVTAVQAHEAYRVYAQKLHGPFFRGDVS